MHDAVRDHDRRPGEMPQNLMPQANAEYRRLSGQKLQKLEAQPGIDRIARTRRDAHHLELARAGQFQDIRIVVLLHNRVAAKLLERLHHVEGEGIEVVNK